jgi:hypothetical protein
MLRIEPQARQLRHVRRVIDVWLESLGFRVSGGIGPGGQGVHSIATELLSIAFAVTPPGGRVQLELRHAPGSLEITVSDPGPEIDPDGVVGSDSDEPRHRGLLIVRGLADQVLVRREHDRTSITAAIEVGG